MTELLNQIQEELTNIQEDAAKFSEKGNKAAGTRVRKSMQVIKGLAQDVRVAVSAANKAQYQILIGIYKVPRKRSLKYWKAHQILIIDNVSVLPKKS